MLSSLLNRLRCPYCGTRLTVVENAALERSGDAIESGVLGCECCAFPVVAGIPVMIAGDRPRAAMHALEAGREEDALFMLLEVDRGRADAFRRLLDRGERATYREALAILSRDAEADYLLHRFSDPTYLTVEGLLSALGPLQSSTAPFIDLCSGAGHVTRALGRHSAGGGTVAADLSFWKLWLAKRFVAPDCQPVCCDGNHPLPFERESAALVVLADAFPYIWHKRLLAGEMMRIASRGSFIVMPHLHSSLGYNFSAGDTLTPASYRDLFAPLSARLFSDARLRDDVIERYIVDLGADLSPEELGDEPSFTLVAQASGYGRQASGEVPDSQHAPGARRRASDVFRRHELLPMAPAADEPLLVNPLYRVERQGRGSLLTLEFPTPEYEEEFGECRRYLPDAVTLDVDVAAPLTITTLGSRATELLRRRILIQGPERY
ncbi:MAG: hypothetical protein AB7F99_02575 [Vicinamibacterales bacterium]